MECRSNSKTIPATRRSPKEDIHFFAIEFWGILAELETGLTDRWKWVKSLMMDESVTENLNSTSESLENEIKKSGSQNLLLLVQILLEVYLRLKIDNPLKQTIISLLSKRLKGESSHILHTIITDIVTSRCVKYDDKFNAKDKKVKVSALMLIREYAEFLHFLSSCINMDMLPPITTEMCIFSIVKASEPMFLLCMVYQRNEKASLVLKEEKLSDLHALIQQLIVILQNKAAGELPPSFIEACINLIKDPILPMNTKFNLGIVICLANKASTTYNIFKLAETMMESTPLTAVALCAGIVSSHTSTNSSLNMDGLCMIINLFLTVDKTYSSDNKMVLAVSRAINVVSKHLLLNDNFTAVKQYLDSFLNYLVPHLDCNVDSVRHLTSEAFNNIILLVSKSKDDECLKKIVHSISEIPEYRRAKFTMISYSVTHVTAKRLLAAMPDLRTVLLNAVDKSSGAKHVLYTLESVMKQHFLEIENKSQWFDIWAVPIVKMIHDDQKSALLSILGEVVKLYPDVLKYIFNLPQNEYPNKMKLVFSCLHITTKLGMTNLLPSYAKENSEILGGILPKLVLKDSLHHRDDDIRLTLLGLLIDMPKRTRAFSDTELELLQTFFKYNIHNQWPSFRQKFISYYKKFVIRLNDSLANCSKLLKNYENRPPEASPKDMTKEKATITNYKEFKSWSLEFAYENLFEGASFSRRNTVLQMLTIFKQYDLLKFDNPMDGQKMSNSLLRVLSTDTYEENKLMAKDLLKGFPLSSFSLQADSIKRAVNDCFKMVSSIRPPDCISASYCLSTLVQIKGTEEAILSLAKSHDCSPEATCFQKSHYAVLSMLAKQLTEELLVAQLDLGEAARNGPLYGLLFMARHILLDVNLPFIGKDDDWQKLMKKFIHLAIDCTKAVSCVVNNSSPEGHLPMDLSKGYTTCLTLKKSDPHLTSQLLLLCSWRTVKEACLLLGEIVKSTPIQPDETHFCTQDIVLIGKHLTTLLAEIKHRGAFEQVYVGFCNLASVLWRSPNGEMSNLPKRWLDDTLNEISSNTSLCATRRSAGIPFIIQALVCTEKDVTGGKKFSNIFHSTISKLIEFGLDSEQSSETRIHSMNILRSLFRNSQLGEHVSSFVDQGFVIAFNSFPSNNWSERNSATLLFSALMTRVFGVLRSKSFTLNWKNKMTSRIFFQRYPALYTVILEKLSAACETNLQTVFPVLLLLSRLYPSSLEGTDSIFELDKFIPYVNKYSSSKIIIVRNLAASALVGLLTPNDIPRQIFLVLESSKTVTKENAVHGLLLQVQQLVKFGTDAPDECGAAFKSSVIDWFQSIYRHFLSDHSLIIKAECLKVMCLLFRSMDPTVDDSNSLVKHILTILSQLKSDTSDFKNVGSDGFITAATSVLIILLSKNSFPAFEECLVSLLKLENYEIFNAVTDFLLNLFDEEYEPSSQNIFTAVEYLKKGKYDDIKCSLKNSEAISNQLLVKFCQEDAHHEDLNKVLMCAKEMNYLTLNVFKEVGGVSKMVESYFTNGTDKLKSSCLHCIVTYFNAGGQCVDTDKMVLGKILNESVFMDYDIRIAAATIITNLYPHLVPSTDNTITIEIWTALLHFACDDSQDVRDIMSNFINDNLKLDSLTTLNNCFTLIEKTAPSHFVFACALAYWSVAPFAEQNNQPLFPPQDPPEEKAFDKGDTNSYKEDLLICKLSCECMTKLFAKTPAALLKPLPEDLVKWLEEFYPIDVEESLSAYRNTIYGFLGVVTMSFSDDMNDVKTGYSYFPYFSAAYCENSLNLCKSGYIYKVLSPFINTK